MLETYPNLFADISSMTQINKLGYLQKTLAEKKFEGKLLYGSDFPLINTAAVSPWYFPAKPDPGADADDQLDRKSLGS